MIVVRISSGLGNQMFQYALCRVFMEKGIQVKADTSSFEKKNERRRYELDKIFGIKMPVASAAEKGMMNAISKVAYKVSGIPYKEQHTEFGMYNKSIPEKKNGYINGYWQSEKYFWHIREKIRQAFQFPPAVDEQNIRLLEQIRLSNAVSMHVRRTDYINGLNWGLQPGYYHNAIELLKSRVDNPQFFIFSDDIPWARQNFKGDNFFFVDFNSGENSFRDMQLMSACDHHIIANSTFSWWGAWLNPSPGKIVVAPDVWLPHINGTRDIIPAGWIQLPVSLGT
jgi:hypothetical protein